MCQRKVNKKKKIKLMILKYRDAHIKGKRYAFHRNYNRVKITIGISFRLSRNGSVSIGFYTVISVLCADC